MRRMKKVLCMAMAVGMTVSSLAALRKQSVRRVQSFCCRGNSGRSPVTATGTPIKVGVSNMVTGPMAAGGLRMKQAVTMAFEEINAKGGSTGRKTFGDGSG